MDKVLYEKRNRIGYVTLNRPDALNALDDQICKGNDSRRGRPHFGGRTAS